LQKNSARSQGSREPLESYCIGLLLPGERKSVEPRAATITAPERVSAQHQSMLHFISQGGQREF